MEIVKIGKFDRNGNPTGWSIDFTEGNSEDMTSFTDTKVPCAVYLGENGEVRIGDIKMRELTDERCRAMGIKIHSNHFGPGGSISMKGTTL